jgi:hypothetical protein
MHRVKISTPFPSLEATARELRIEPKRVDRVVALFEEVEASSKHSGYARRMRRAKKKAFSRSRSRMKASR